MIKEIKIMSFGSHKKTCSKCLKEVKKIWISYSDLDQNIFIKQKEGICKRCLNNLIDLCGSIPTSKLNIGIIKDHNQIHY